ncbi:Replication-associated recombination protein A [Acholeplasma oculi]|uniref:Holliday junction, RuvB type n=1 Tax=Acholeplasma oculi TaxID=35623 RepID=A0A061AC73_9MOLU|nr:AAA family ATPase [Acholeplasma oculi]CDR31009.1 Holliday junction, RuvB type [Acholeplasma oculi]SKC36283.1 Recombination protein MgsA [Acholeplasma oculi]SUT90463.1 Replication-associated recombination protein A [Acholeplasma oculi]
MEPLASKMRPIQLSDVLGQDHLISNDGVLTMMLEKKKWLSFILYGPPGTGKTTIAKLFSEASQLDTFFFNASTDNKARLKDILDMTAYHDILIIVDEIHRMKTDIQDYLLPFLESGKAIMIGLTTLNPYQSINLAIRSRCHLYEVKSLSDEDIKKAIYKGISYLDVPVKLTDDAVETIIRASNHEIRSALNLLESASLVVHEGKTITSNIIRKLAGKPQLSLDDHEDHYYEMLSALQKSIRGSDVDASLHYLARLITLGDLEVILRRLIVIAYEDIGLANPTMGQKAVAVYQASKMLGLPEARIPLSTLVVDMALSPKSNTAHVALDEAIADFQNGITGDIPKHVDNKYLKVHPEVYHYPHNDPGSINSEQYLPEKILKKKYYKPKQESAYEKALSERKKIIDKLKGY